MNSNTAGCVDFSTGIDELLDDDNDSVNMQEPEIHKDNKSGEHNGKNKKKVKFENNSKIKSAPPTCRDKGEKLSPILKKKQPPTG